MKPFPRKLGIIYGPIRSRRLGLSLGVNLLPSTYKLCSFNCCYCQLGWTLKPTFDPSADAQGRPGERIKDLPTPSEVLVALEAGLQRLHRQGIQLDAITFSGNGEPTLHPQLKQIARTTRRFRDKYVPNAKLVILSNSSTVGKEEVREALEEFDLKIMKLDAGDLETVRRLNHPASPFDLEEVIKGLKRLNEVILQSLFVQGRVSNVEPPVVEAWIQRVGEIKPFLVQVYTLDRIPADPGLRPVEQPTLKNIALTLGERTGIKAEVY